MWVALRDFVEPDERGRPVTHTAGSPVDVGRRQQMRRLLKEGKILLKTFAHGTVRQTALNCNPNSKLRVAFVQFISNWYSGGRIHLYQFAHCLAANGAEVFVVAPRHPVWASDYPHEPNLKLVDNAGKLPRDIDVVVTDGKGAVGVEARRTAKGRRLVCFSFETPNWVQDYAPDYSRRLGVGDGKNHNSAYRAADMLLVALAEECAKKSCEWYGISPKHWRALPPALNEHALDSAGEWRKLDVPYCAACGRNADYKGFATAYKTVCAMPPPMGLALVGQKPHKMPAQVEGHPLHFAEKVADAEKFAIFKNARAVLAPSLFEGFGMVPMEALAAGTPVAAYDLPVLRQAYGDRLAYAKHGDEADFAGVASRLVESGQRPGPETRAWIRKTYGMPAMARRADALPYLAVKRRRVSAHMIAYSCAGLPAYAIESVYPHVDEILVAYGPTELARGFWPDDGTLEAIEAFPDPDGKIKLEVKPAWKNKLEMRQSLADRMEGNFILELDGDEIWTGLDALVKSGPDYARLPWVNFWHDASHWVRDIGDVRRWGVPTGKVGSWCHHWRFSRWRASFKYRSHPHPVDCSGKALVSRCEPFGNAIIWHLGHVLPKPLMDAKHKFYIRRDGADAGRIKRREAWCNWDGKCGPCGDGVVEPVTFEVPDIVARAFRHLESENAVMAEMAT